MDYLIEFHNQLATEIHKLTARMPSDNLYFSDCFLSRAINNEIYYKYALQHDRYNELRVAGFSKHESISKILTSIDNNYSIQPNILQTDTIPQISLYDANMYTGLPIIIVLNYRQLDYLKPLLRRFNGEIICLSLCNPDKTIINNTDFDNVIFIRYPYFNLNNYTTGFLSDYFPNVLRHTFTLDFIFNKLHPSTIINLEGCNTISQLSAIISSKYNIPSVCIQHGWPSFFHLGFQYLPYNYILTWGNGFNSIWKSYNPTVNCISTGYMYNITNDISPRTKITFFLQGPYVISCTEHLNTYINAIKYIATKFPRQSICVREHPEFHLSNDIHQELSAFSNIEFVTNYNLMEVYGTTRFAIAHFSSTIMESAIHGCVPIVFDPTYNSSYTPDLSAVGLGFMSKTITELSEILSLHIPTFVLDKQNVSKNLHNWIHSIGDKTLDNITSFISTLNH